MKVLVNIYYKQLKTIKSSFVKFHELLVGKAP